MSRTWLAHHGILGQKWGVRRFQNPDGSLTSKGKQRYGTGDMTHDRVLKEENKRRLELKTRMSDPISNALQKINDIAGTKRDVVSKDSPKLRDKLSGINPKTNHPVIEGVRKDGVESAKKRNKEWDKNRSTMDDKELDQALNRLRKENELHRLTQNGNNFAKEALKESGKRIISTVVAGTALYGGKVLVSKVLKNPEMADFVFPGGGKKKKDKDKGDN